MDNVDLKKHLKHLYEAHTDSVSEVDVPMLCFLMADGRGDHDTSPLCHWVIEVLSGVRRVEPQRWRTLIRQPMR